MNLASYLVKEAIIPNLTAASRDEAIAEMVRSLHKHGKLPGADIDSVIQAVIRREQLGSTGIGRGVAIPHTRHRDVGSLVGTVARHSSGLSYDAIDGEPVHVLFLLLSPDSLPGPHLRALDSIVQKTKDNDTLNKIINSKTVDEIWEQLQ